MKAIQNLVGGTMAAVGTLMVLVGVYLLRSITTVEILFRGGFLLIVGITLAAIGLLIVRDTIFIEGNQPQENPS